MFILKWNFAANIIIIFSRPISEFGEFVCFISFFRYKSSMYAKRSHRRFGRWFYCTEFLLLLLLSPIDVRIHNIYFCAKIEHVYSFILSGIFKSAIVLFGFVLWTTNRNLKMQNRQSAVSVCGALVCEWPRRHRWPIKSPSLRRQHYRSAHPKIMSACDCPQCGNFSKLCFKYSWASAMPG